MIGIRKKRYIKAESAPPKKVFKSEVPKKIHVVRHLVPFYQIICRICSLNILADKLCCIQRRAVNYKNHSPSKNRLNVINSLSDTNHVCLENKN